MYYSETMVRHHYHNTVNHGQTFCALQGKPLYFSANSVSGACPSFLVVSSVVVYVGYS